MRGLPFDRKVEALLLDRPDVALIVRPMLVAWRQLREQVVAFDKSIRALVRSNSACRLLMSVPGVGVLSALVYVSTVEDPARFVRSRSGGAHLGLTPRQYQSGEVDRSGRISKCGVLTRLKRASSLKDWTQAISKRSGAGKARVALARKLSVILHSIWRSGPRTQAPLDRDPRRRAIRERRPMIKGCLRPDCGAAAQFRDHGWLHSRMRRRHSASLTGSPSATGELAFGMEPVSINDPRPLDGIVTSLKEEHENSASRIFSSDRDRLAPHVHSRRAIGSVCPCRN
jgi:Transposase IS116/IS110/IS902 family